MSQIFQADGTVIPVTVVSLETEFADDVVGKDVVVVGTSKGKGFTGVVKRWGFKGGPATHGQSDRHRAPGSSGGKTVPGRVYKGKRRAGRHGNKQVTIKGLKIVQADMQAKRVMVSGPVPGARNSKLFITVVESN